MFYREHDELIRQVEDSVSVQERKDLQSEQERLLLKMERKGEQISKLYKHKSQVCFHICKNYFPFCCCCCVPYRFLSLRQIKKLRKEANSRQSNRSEARVCTTVSTRGRSVGAVKVRPGERSKINLRLLRDMKALQTSLQT